MSTHRATSILSTQWAAARRAGTPRGNHLLTGVVALAIALTLAGRCQADIFLDFSGSHAQGDINGVAFSGASWLYEAQIDTSVSNTSGTPGVGFFSGAIVGTSIQINGTTYGLGGTFATGNIQTADQSYFGAYQGNYIILNPTAGGVLQFITAGGGLFPTLFTDYSDLGTFVPGATVSDNTIDSFSNASRLQFPPFRGNRFNPPHAGLVSTAGDTINIFDFGSAGGGTFGLNAQPLNAAVPEPASLIIWSLMVVGVGIAAWMRRRRAA